MSSRRMVPMLVLFLLLVVPAISGCSAQEPVSSETERADAPAEAEETDSATEEFQIMSAAFEDGSEIPKRFCDTGVEGGENVSIPYSWQGTPEGTKSFALLLVDHHEVADEWVHWIVVDIPGEESSLAEGASPDAVPGGARELTNTSGVAGYSGPQPPAGTGAHPYEATLYALGVDSLDVEDGASLADLTLAIEEIEIGRASVTGYFER